MATNRKQPAIVAEEKSEATSDNGLSRTVEPGKVPVAYEEVVLTEEAAELLEQMRQEKALTEPPPRKPRRIPTGDGPASSS